MDTNVLVALLGGATGVAGSARRALERASGAGALVVSPPVYAELVAAPGREAREVEDFLGRTRIGVDWELGEDVWRVAALAYKGYAERRRGQPGDAGPRRILADFVIGAHASRRASALLTLDLRVYRAAFPELEVLVPE